MNEPSDLFGDMIRGLRAGDPRTADAFWRQYGDGLQRVANMRLPKGLRHRVAPEDVVQSVCRTFIRRAKEGQFQLSDGASMWSLLCAITLTKVHEQVRFHLRQKRGANREVSDAFSSESGASSGLAPADSAPTPADAAEFADQFQHLLESMNAEERRIIELKLDDCNNDQIAQQMGCSERTVRRILKQLQSRLNKELDSSPG